MRVRYGGIPFGNQQCRLDAVESQTIYEGLMPVGVSKTWRLYGELYAANLAALNLQIASLEALFREPGRELVLLDNAGARTAHSLGGLDSRCGCRILEGPTFLPATGVEMSTKRSWSATISADYDFILPGLVVGMTESITIQGDGGPMWSLLPTLLGPPVKQVLRQRTPVRVTQSGTVVGRYRRVWPQEVLREFLPGYRVGPLSSVTPQMATIRDGLPGRPVELNFPTSYTWVFEAPAGVFGDTNHWRH